MGNEHRYPLVVWEGGGGATGVVPDDLKACPRFVRRIGITNVCKVDSKYT